MPTLRRHVVLALAAATIALTGCAAFDDVEVTPVENPGAESATSRRPLAPFEQPSGTLFDGTLLSSGAAQGGGQGAQLPVNKYLWRATLDTLAFLPLASTDPYGGVIVTDWGATEAAPDERFKVTAFITSAVLKPQSLRVVVNRQKRADNGEWLVAPVADETPRTLEDAILTRARQIKIEAGDES